MAGRRTYIVVEALLLTIFCFSQVALCDKESASADPIDTTAIPSDKSKLASWFEKNIQELKERKDTLDPAVVKAEANPKVIKLKSDGSGDYKTITDAIKSIPEDNKERVIISLGGGNYSEKIKIERNKPFITFYGDPKNMPVLVNDGTAAKHGTVGCATLVVEAPYFNGVNLIIVNSAPRPDGKREGAQAVALQVSGDRSSFYGCQIHGFQDTLLDDNGMHFFKDCYIEGTVDFIFGNGKSLYLDDEIHVISGDQMAMITAHSRDNPEKDSGYSFVHCNVTGTGGIASLGRPWKSYASVVFSYSELSDVVNPQGWSDNNKPDIQKTIFYGEFQNSGPGSDMSKRAKFVKDLKDEKDAKPYITLGWIEASKWLLPPTTL